MVREFIIGGNRVTLARAWLVPVVPGVMLFLFGILVLLVPQVLVALVSGAFMVAGIALISVGLALRNGKARTFRPPPFWQ